MSPTVVLVRKRCFLEAMAAIWNHQRNLLQQWKLFFNKNLKKRKRLHAGLEAKILEKAFFAMWANACADTLF